MRDISGEQQELKEEISGVSEDVRTVLNTAMEPFLVLDSDLRGIAANKKFCTTFELITREIEGKTVSEMSAFWDSPEFLYLLEDLLPKNGQVKDFVISQRSKNNKRRNFQVSANQLKKRGEVFTFLSFKDLAVPERRSHGQIRFLKSFRDILAHAPAMICILKGPLHFFEVANDKYLQLVGQSDIVGKPVREVLPEVENQGFFEILDKVFSSGEPYIGNEVLLNLKKADGGVRTCYLDFLYQPTWDATGAVDGIFVHSVDVTEKVLARKKLEESKNRLRSLVDTMPAIVWISDKDGYTSYLNKNWYKYTGQTKEEANRLGWLGAVHPTHRKLVKDAFLKGNKEQKAFNNSFLLYNRDGNYRWVLNNGRPKFDSYGEYEGLIGTLVDVHEEKLKEQLIREKEHRIRSIVEEANVATAVYTGENMEIELANDVMIDLWGKDRSVIGKKLRDALPELEGQPFHELLQEVYRTGKTYWGKEDQVNLVKGDELKTRYFNFTYKPLRNEDGEIYGILNMAVDVTDMVESKALLKESELHFRRMADLMPEKVATTNDHGKFVYFNQGWIDYTGFSSEELQSNGWDQFIHPDDKEAYLRNWEYSMKTGEGFEIEFRFSNSSGKYNWHLGRAEAVKDEDGKITMWITTNTEIQKLKEEEKRKEDFLKMVSHELKTPITSIKGYVQLLLNLMAKEKEAKSSSSLPIKPSLERINHQIERLTRLISEMLDLSRIEENKLTLQKVNFSINSLVDDTVQDIYYTNTQLKIKVVHNHHAKVFADKDRIGQVLINLVTNAIKYSPESQEVEVRVEQYSPGRVSVCIKDHGIGIDEKNQKDIFKRFYRAGMKSEETYSGFGIGLYLAKEIVERHEGDLSVKSKKGKGSEFRFTLNEVEDKQ